MGQTRTSADVCSTTGSPPEADMTGSPSDVAFVPKGDMTRVCLADDYLLLASAFETSRAHSMKRSTTGLSVRFFRVMIVTIHVAAGKPIDNAFREQKRATDLG
jgi:hypothetical protein